MEQEKEMSFEELVKKASEIADARTKAYVNLQKKLEEDYIPKMQEILCKLNKASVRIVTETPLLTIKEDYSDSFRIQDVFAIDYEYDEKYCVFVTQDALVEGFYNYQKGWGRRNEREYRLKKSGVVEFARKIKEKLADLIKIAEEEEKAANEALKF